tara:strand:- start:3555 stop:3707 length:153 start_codon:yes stop_codon:yes gene_type:complete
VLAVGNVSDETIGLTIASKEKTKYFLKLRLIKSEESQQLFRIFPFSFIYQ